jgi:hypothetical protein
VIQNEMVMEKEYNSDKIVMKRTVYMGWNDDEKQYKMKSW